MTQDATHAAKDLLASLDPDTLNPEQFNAWHALDAALRTADPVEAAAPSEEPVAVTDRLHGWLAGTFAYTAYRGRAPDGVPQLRSDIRTILDRASPAVAPVAVSVKELEWSGPNTLADGQIVWSSIAEGMEFTYSIWTAGVGYEERFFCAKVLPQLFDSLDEAKAAVQFNYAERILSAIVTASPKCCTICGSAERCEACAEVNEIAAGIEGTPALQSHVGHSLANDTWFARFYPFASEAEAKAFNARILSSIIPATKGGEEDDAPFSKIFALPLRLGRGTRNEAPIFDRHGELVGECVDDDCEERALAFIRAVNSPLTVLELQAAIRVLRLSLNQARAELAALAQDTDATPPVAPTGTVRTRPLTSHARTSPGPINCNLRLKMQGHEIDDECERCNGTCAGDCLFFYVDGQARDVPLSAPTVEGEGL